MKTNVKIVMNAVCDYFQISEIELFSEETQIATTKPRHIFYYLCLNNCDVSLSCLGRYTGKYSNRKQNHATVHYARKTITSEITPTKGFKGIPSTIKQVNELTKLIEWYDTKHKFELNPGVAQRYFDYVPNIEMGQYIEVGALKEITFEKSFVV